MDVGHPVVHDVDRALREGSELDLLVPIGPGSAGLLVVARDVDRRRLLAAHLLGLFDDVGLAAYGDHAPQLELDAAADRLAVHDRRRVTDDQHRLGLLGPALHVDRRLGSGLALEVVEADHLAGALARDAAQRRARLLQLANPLALGLLGRQASLFLSLDPRSLFGRRPSLRLGLEARSLFGL